MGSKRLLVCAFLGEIVPCHLSGHPSLSTRQTRRLTQASQLIVREIQKTVVNKSKSHGTNEHQRKISSYSHSEGLGGQLEPEKDDQIAFSPTPDLVTDNKS